MSVLTVSRREFLWAVGLGGAAVSVLGGSALGLGRGAGTTEPPAPPTAFWRPPGGPTIAGLAASLDYDTQRIFRYVADEIHYDGYVGVLRGARGTLWSRAGNSVDQAVLLAALLAEARVDVRFASGRLDETAANRLGGASALSTDDYATRAGAIFVPTELPPDGPELSPEHRQLLDDLPATIEQVLASSRGQRDEAVATILGALAAAGIDIPAVGPVVPDPERERHVWVQYADGPTWIDLDPTILGATPGDPLTVADTTFDALPDDSYHLVGLRLIAESLTSGALSRQDIFTWEGRVSDLTGLPITLLHAKPEGLMALGAGIAASFEGTIEYAPAVAIGDEVVVGDGRITFNTGEGIMSALGEEAVDGDTIAEFLELTVTAPGAEPQSSTRAIFDRLGHVERERGSLDPASITPIELVDLDEQSPNEFLPVRGVWSLAVEGGSVPWQFFDQDPTITDVFADLALVSEGYHFVREALHVDAAPLGVRTFASGANVLAFTVTPVGINDAGPQLELAVDLLARDLAVATLDGDAPTAEARIASGVISHVAERVLGGEWREEVRGAPLAASVGRVFEEAERQGIEVVALSDAVGVDGLDISEEARLRITAAIEGGWVVVVPIAGVDLGDEIVSGWWLVDPTTGAVADEFEDGRGSETGEYALPLTAEARAIDAFRRLGGCVAKYAIFGAAIFGATGEIANAGGAAGVAGALGVIAKAAEVIKDAAGEAPLAGLC